MTQHTPKQYVRKARGHDDIVALPPGDIACLRADQATTAFNPHDLAGGSRAL